MISMGGLSAALSASTKRVQCFWNTSFIVPVGPLRCLPMIISASSSFLGTKLLLYVVPSFFAASSFSFSSFCLYTASRYTNKIISASCSIEPDSRKSDNIGRLSLRDSKLLFSCDNAMIGISSSLAIILSPRLISLTSWCLSRFPSPLINCK